MGPGASWAAFLSAAEAGGAEPASWAARARGLGAVGGDNLLRLSTASSSSLPPSLSVGVAPFLPAGTGTLGRLPGRGELLSSSATGEEPLELLVGNNRKHKLGTQIGSRSVTVQTLC